LAVLASSRCCCTAMASAVPPPDSDDWCRGAEEAAGAPPAQGVVAAGKLGGEDICSGGRGACVLQVGMCGWVVHALGEAGSPGSSPAPRGTAQHAAAGWAGLGSSLALLPAAAWLCPAAAHLALLGRAAQQHSKVKRGGRLQAATMLPPLLRLLRRRGSSRRLRRGRRGRHVGGGRRQRLAERRSGVQPPRHRLPPLVVRVVVVGGGGARSRARAGAAAAAALGPRRGDHAAKARRTEQVVCGARGGRGMVGDTDKCAWVLMMGGGGEAEGGDEG
jgi:hypothetical protein